MFFDNRCDGGLYRVLYAKVTDNVVTVATVLRYLSLNFDQLFFFTPDQCDVCTQAASSCVQ